MPLLSSPAKISVGETGMIRLTEAQVETLNRMPRYHIAEQFVTGAAVVVCESLYQNAMVIDLDGQVLAFSRYLAIRDQRR